MEHFNQLTPAEAERLAILAEECGEVIQVIGKILRHGYESHNPNNPDAGPNREQLAREIGDVQAIKEMMQDAGDISTGEIIDAKREKLVRVKRYLHHHIDPAHKQAMEDAIQFKPGARGLADA